MRIRIAFVEGQDGDMPTMVEGYDEFTEDAWQGVPDFYIDALSKQDGRIRELDLFVADDVVKNLFRIKGVDVLKTKEVE